MGEQHIICSVGESIMFLGHTCNYSCELSCSSLLNLSFVGHIENIGGDNQIHVALYPFLYAAGTVINIF